MEFFDSSNRYITYVVSHSATQISNTYHNVVKHCIEVTYKGLSKKFHAGFSNSDSQRTFLSFVGESGSIDGYPGLMELYEPAKYHLPHSNINVSIGSKVLVCLDSANKVLHAICGSQHETLSYSTIVDNNRWYAALSGSSSKILSKASLNIGFDKFENTIPSGFAPWIVGIDGIVDVKPQKCACTNKKKYNS